MEVRLQNNIKEFTKELNAIQREQLPFATSLALNAIAVEAQEAVVKSIPSKFKNRKKWWLRQQPTGIKVKFTDRRKNNLHQSRVYTDAAFMVMQETGGTRQARRKNIAVPKKENVLDKFEKAGSAHLLLNDKKQYFKTDTAIYRRLKKGRLKYMYALTPTAKIKPRFGFAEIIKKVVMRRFERIFREKLNYAVKTRKAK